MSSTKSSSVAQNQNSICWRSGWIGYVQKRSIPLAPNYDSVWNRTLHFIHSESVVVILPQFRLFTVSPCCQFIFDECRYLPSGLLVILSPRLLLGHMPYKVHEYRSSAFFFFLSFKSQAAAVNRDEILLRLLSKWCSFSATSRLSLGKSIPRGSPFHQQQKYKKKK